VPVLTGLARKAAQVAADPVLRRWLAGRALGRWDGAPPYQAHRPPYLDGLLPLEPEAPAPPRDFPTLGTGAPARAVDLTLPGEDVRLEPGREADLFRRKYDDTETLLAAHRFAWLPVLGDSADPAWVAALWAAWRQSFGTPGGGWPWHPYTAAERAVNVLDFAARHGLPGPLDDTLSVLAAHGPAIAERLEYFGEHHTSNHLSNNGRGLFRLGLELGLAQCADMGARILLEEARRIFRPSGVLREDSSHYHLLLARNYLDAWKAARSHGRPEADQLKAVADKALAVVPHLTLPGGLALVGDISPDLPPAPLQLQIAECVPAATENSGALAADGWLRADIGPWAGLWHAPPNGWSHMPGHGHQDLGAFEVHYKETPLFLDPGRGAYGDGGDAAFYRAAQAHGGLTVDGLDPYPPNRPYYSDSFRSTVGGAAPRLARDGDAVTLVHYGYSRLKGSGPVTRGWEFTDNGFSLSDQVEGAGPRTVTRRLVTPLAAEAVEDGIILRGEGHAFQVTADTKLTTRPITRWTAYGSGTPATLIEMEVSAPLPWRGTCRVEVL